MGMICKGMDFKSEERAIRNQVSQGKRCSDCLKLFNSGERKRFKAGSSSVICQRCWARESFTSGILGKEEASESHR